MYVKGTSEDKKGGSLIVKGAVCGMRPVITAPLQQKIQAQARGQVSSVTGDKSFDADKETASRSKATDTDTLSAAAQGERGLVFI